MSDRQHHHTPRGYLHRHPNPSADDAVRAMLVGYNVVTTEELETLSAAVTCVIATEVYSESPDGGGDYWSTRFHPFGRVPPAEEVELLERSLRAQHHFLMQPDAKKAIEGMMSRCHRLRPGQVLRACAIVTHVDWVARRPRTDVWWPTGPVPSLLARGLLKQALADARRSSQSG